MPNQQHPELGIGVRIKPPELIATVMLPDGSVQQFIYDLTPEEAFKTGQLLLFAAAYAYDTRKNPTAEDSVFLKQMGVSMDDAEAEQFLGIDPR